MKKILIGFSALIVAAFCLAIDMPDYESGQYFVWESDQGDVATNALNYINGLACFPITGRNASTGEDQADQSKAQSWISDVMIRVDGKYCFPRPADCDMTCFGLSASDCTNFFTVYNPTVELYTNSWFNFGDD